MSTSKSGNEGGNLPEETKRQTDISREELYRQVWETPMERLAKQYGLTGRGLAKKCDRLQVPYPHRGYWAKKQAGKAVRKLPLPPAKADTLLQTTLVPTLPRPTPPTIDVETAQRFATAIQQVSAVRVPEKLIEPHPEVAVLLAVRARQIAEARRHGVNTPKAFTPLEDRRNRILDTLYKELSKHKFVARSETYKGTWLEVGQEHIDFELAERLRQERRSLTPEQRASSFYPHKAWTQVKIQTGQLRFRIKTDLGHGLLSEWTDQDAKPLEDVIGEILATLLLAKSILRQRREHAEGQERQRRKTEQLRQKEAERLRKEAFRMRRFLELSQRWKAAESARAFLAVIEGLPPAGEGSFGNRTHQEWLAWTKSQIDDLDPLSDGASEIWKNLAEITPWEYDD